MLALLAACLWLAGCSGDGPDGGSGNLNIVFDCSMPLQVVAGETCEVGYTLEGASENARVRVVAPDGYRVQVIETNYWSGKIVIYLPDAATDERIVVILSDEGNETVSRYIDLEVKAKSDVVFDLSANSYLIEAEGTSLRVILITNIDYTVEIAEKDRTWISVETSRTDQREESLVFSFRPNSDVKSRQATVRLVDSEGNLLDSICFTQATSGSVNVRLERADVWTQVIWLSGSCASDVAQAGFRYRKQGDKEWVEVAGAGSSNGFSAHVEAEPETTYEIMACWRDEESRIHIVTTLPALKLPNGDFEEWNFSEEGAFWATSIVRGYPEMGLPQPTIRPGSSGKYAVKLQKEEWGSIVKDLYGGHIFTGINVDPAAGSGVIGVLSMLWNIYGQLFEATPTALRGWLQCRNVMSTDTKEQEATIRIALGTWSPAPDHDVKIPEHPVVDQYLEEALDPSCSDLIAYGELQVAEDVDWQQFTIPLEYLRTDRKPTHLIIACDAGSRILCLDDFELLYDYNF